MGINKVPENGHNLFTAQAHKNKSKLTAHGKHGAIDNLSTQKSGVKSKAGNAFAGNARLVNGITPRKGTGAATLPTNAANPKKPSFSSGFSLNKKDSLTGKLFSDLAKRSFEKRRPYCFAAGVVDVRKSLEYKKLFMDGAEYFYGVEEDTFKMPHRLMLNSGEKIELTDVCFFAVRENNSIDTIGSIHEALKGVNSTIMQTIILEDENELYQSTGNTTSVLIAGAYHLGIGVNSDKEYARSIMPNINDKQKKEATPDAFGLALMCQDSPRLVKFLLDNDFDPRIKDPDDESTGIQMAINNGNEEVIQLFEKYGYWKNT